MTMSVMGNNYMAMDSSSNNLLTFDGTVYAPVTECASYTDYEPSSTAGASSTGNAETDSAETARVQLSIGSNDARQFSVPTDNSIFVLVNDVGVQADRFEVLTGPEGVTCTAWSDKEAKKQLGMAVAVGDKADLPTRGQQSVGVKGVKCQAAA